MTVTVVIPCYNEEAYVGRLLQDLTKQTVQPEAVIVADCHSEDKTVNVAQTFAKQLPLRIVQSPYRSAAAARNTGADAAKTDFLLFLDADMRLPPAFLAKLKRRAQTKQVDFVSPRLKTEGRHPVDHLLVWFINLWTHFYHMLIRRHAAGVGGAMLIKRETHYAIGKYNPRLREFDDIDYMRKMWKHKISFAYARNAVTTTSNRRLVRQGRFATLLQSLSDHHFLVRRFVRPLMKKLGIKPHWSDLD